MAILRMTAPDLGFGFAWEPESRNLFIISAANGAPHEQIATNVTSPELAQKLTEMWCRGYRSRAREIARKPGSKHYHMLAETGEVGTKMGGP